MTSGRAAGIAAVALLVGTVSVVALLTRPRSFVPATTTTVSMPVPVSAAPSRTIKVRLFYVSDDGTRLTSVEREVPFAEGPEQAREIVNAQIAPVALPLVSAVPSGTALRAVFITDRGDAYVDLSRDAISAHPGG